MNFVRNNYYRFQFLFGDKHVYLKYAGFFRNNHIFHESTGISREFTANDVRLVDITIATESELMEITLTGMFDQFNELQDRYNS